MWLFVRNLRRMIPTSNAAIEVNKSHVWKCLEIPTGVFVFILDKFFLSAARVRKFT